MNILFGSKQYLHDLIMGLKIRDVRTIFANKENILVLSAIAFAASKPFLGPFHI